MNQCPTCHQSIKMPTQQEMFTASLVALLVAKGFMAEGLSRQANDLINEMLIRCKAEFQTEP